MKRFQFRLQSVLNYRDRIEHQRGLIFARAVQTVQAQQRELMGLYELTSESMEDMRRQSSDRVDVAALRQERLYLASVRKRIAQAIKRLRVIEHELDRARRSFIDARKDHRVLELLREGRVTQHQYETDRDERKELDEIGSRPWQIERSAG